MRYKHTHSKFKIKAIETVYKGYRFRSRIEARWAVFFDELGIKWEYEKEGYDLEGTWYLPDFWLPELDCFFEVKGCEPTEEEIEKASLLALYTGKYAYIAYGSIGSHDSDDQHSIYAFNPPILHKCNLDEDLRPASWVKLEMSLESGIIVQKLDEVGISLATNMRGTSLVFEQRDIYLGEDPVSKVADKMQERYECLRNLETMLTDHQHELINLYTIQQGEEIRLLEMCCREMEVVECTTCESVYIHFQGAKEFTTFNGYPKCKKCHEGEARYDSSRLIEAYTAARQARFEAGRTQ